MNYNPNDLPWRVMRKLICTIVSLAALLAVAPAGATWSFCGHYDKYFNNGNSLADYRGYSFSNGTHWHIYNHLNRVPNGSFVFAHSYSRNCNVIV